MWIEATWHVVQQVAYLHSDTVMCVGEANVSDLVALCLDHARPAK